MIVGLAEANQETLTLFNRALPVEGLKEAGAIEGAVTVVSPVAELKPLPAAGLPLSKVVSTTLYPFEVGVVPSRYTTFQLVEVLP